MTYVYFSLLTIALVAIQCLIGGNRMIYGFPPYALAGLAAALSVASVRRPFARPDRYCLGSAMLLAGYVIVRAFFSPNAYLARPDAYMAAACLVVYLLTALYIVEARFRMWIAGALFLVAMFHVGLGAYQFKTGNEVMLFGFFGSGAYGSRAHGMLICPNHFAGFLEAIALVALGLTLWSKCNIAVKFLMAYVIAACFVGVAISGSRGGYLSTVAGLVTFAGLCLWIVRVYNRKRFWLWLVAVVVALAALIATALSMMKYSAPIRERLARVGTASEDVRWYNWLASVDQFKLDPIFGTGAGTHLYYGRLFRRPQIQSDPEHCHNDYLELLSEYGLIGGVLGAAFLIVHIRFGLKTLRLLAIRRFCIPFISPRSDTFALTIGALSAVGAIAAHSFVDFNLHIPGNALLFAFLFGTLASSGIMVEDEAERFPKGEAIARGALIFTGIALVAIIGFRIKSENRTNRARLALGGDQYVECIRLAKLASKKDPANFWNYFYQGEANRALAARVSYFALKEGYLKEAIEAYRKGLKLFPQDENLWVRLGQCLDALYLFDDANDAYRKAMENDPKLGLVYAYYARHQRLAGDLEEAAKSDETAQKLGAKLLPETEMGKTLKFGNTVTGETLPPAK